MKRQAEGIVSRVYAYGCGLPVSGWQYAKREAERMASLWDVLVRIDRDYDQAIETAAAQDTPELAALFDDIGVLSTEIRQLKDIGADADSVYSERRIARRKTWPLIAAWKKVHKIECDIIEDTRRRHVNEARIAFTTQSADRLHWGNSNAVVQRYDAARKVVRQFGRQLRESDLRDVGCLTLQLQRTRSGLGADPNELQDGTVADIQLGRVDTAVYDLPTPRGRETRTMLSMRVDAAHHHVEIPVFAHRPLPEGCRVKQAQLTWRQGTRTEHKLCLTLTMPAQSVVSRGSGRAIVRVSLRIQMRASAAHPDHPRASLIVAETDNGRHILTLSERWMREMDRVDALPKAIKDETLPSDLRRYWSMQRPGLWARLLRERREQFRLWAREVATSYREIVIETPRLGALAIADDDTPQNAVRHRACAHQLVAELRHQCAKHGCAAEVIASGPLLREAKEIKIKRLREAKEAKKASPRAAPQQTLRAQQDAGAK